MPENLAGTGKHFRESDGYPLPVFATRAMPYTIYLLHLEIATFECLLASHSLERVVNQKSTNASSKGSVSYLSFILPIISMWSSEYSITCNAQSSLTWVVTGRLTDE